MHAVASVSQPWPASLSFQDKTSNCQACLGLQASCPGHSPAAIASSLVLPATPFRPRRCLPRRRVACPPKGPSATRRRPLPRRRVVCPRHPAPLADAAATALPPLSPGNAGTAASNSVACRVPRSSEAAAPLSPRRPRRPRAPSASPCPPPTATLCRAGLSESRR